MAEVVLAIAIVAERADQLARSFHEIAEARNIECQPLAPDTLAHAKVHLGKREFRLNGREIAGILFRANATSSFSDGFASEDRAFCDVETAAIWLAAMQLPGVLSINRYDAWAWFDGSGWPVWRRRLRNAGVPVSPLWIGDGPETELPGWLPYSGREVLTLPGSSTRKALACASPLSVPIQRSLLVCGEVVSGANSPTLQSAAAALSRHGLQVVEIVTDELDRIFTVDTNPFFSDPHVATRAGRVIADSFSEYLLRR